MNSKRVSFSPVTRRHFYENDGKSSSSPTAAAAAAAALPKQPSSRSSCSSDSRRESVRRRYCETLMVKKPSLNQVRDVFDECRNHAISVVFGNLGRQPRLLDYYLDFYFKSSETVGVKAQWPTGSAYETKRSVAVEGTADDDDDDRPPPEEFDFLIVLEPFFGYTVVKPPGVAHLVVFSSHLCIVSPPRGRERFFLLQVAPYHRLGVPTALRPYAVPWTPPVFYDDDAPFRVPPKPKHVLVDVTGARSAHEAYLRCLTGRELLSDRPYSIDINKNHQDTLRVQIQISRKAVVDRFGGGGGGGVVSLNSNNPHATSLEEWYWKDFEKSFHFPPLHTFVLKRNLLSSSSLR